MSTHTIDGPVTISIDDGSGKFRNITHGQAINLFTDDPLITKDVWMTGRTASYVITDGIEDELRLLDLKKSAPPPIVPAARNRKEKRRQAALARKRR